MNIINSSMIVILEKRGMSHITKDSWQDEWLTHLTPWCNTGNVEQYLMMESESCRPSRLRHSSSLQRQMMLSRAEVGMMELDRSRWRICSGLNNGKNVFVFSGPSDRFVHFLLSLEGWDVSISEVTETAAKSRSVWQPNSTLILFSVHLCIWSPISH